MKKHLMLALGATAMISSTALAHHSYAMFDQRKTLLLDGTVKQMQWTNPHAWMQVMVTYPGGKQLEWSIEMSAPNAMYRDGWKRDTLKPGDKVKVMTNPLRDGRPGGSLVNVTLPDGKQLGRLAGADGAPIRPTLTLLEHQRSSSKIKL